MTQNFRDIAGEVAAEMNNHKLPAKAEEFLDFLEPISENIFKLLPCFEGCNSLDGVFSICSDQLDNKSIYGSELLTEIESFGEVGHHRLSNSEISIIQPDWFTVHIQAESHQSFRYFSSFQQAVSCISQQSLLNQIFEFIEGNTDHDWKSIIKYQLITSLAIVKWHELTNDLDRCRKALIKTFIEEGLIEFNTTGEFMLNYMKNKENVLEDLYYSRFNGAPDSRDFKKPAKWAWYVDHLPEHR